MVNWLVSDSACGGEVSGARGVVSFSCVGRVGGGLACECVGGCGWVRKQSRVVWWLMGGVGGSVLSGLRLGCVVVGVDGWLLAGWLWLVLVVSAAMSRGGGGGVGVGRWWRVWGLGGPWCWTGEVHTSQCSALQSGWESV